MKTSAIALVLGLLVSGPAEAKPRLGVVIVVDQMRPEYLERDPAFSGGFKRLAAEGAVFSDARHLHVPTETGPGHAAISTGRQPSVHGIVGNDWYDRVAGAETYCVADAAYGRGPEHLDGPTLADALKASDPKARVFSISAKDRSAVILGGRRADLALWFDRAAGEFTTSGYYRRPAWLAAFNARLKASGRLPLKDGRVPKKIYAGPVVDEVTRELVSELVAREKVGRGSGTDLLFVSFSATDFVGHAYGTEVPEMDEQLRRLDKTLGLLLDELTRVSRGSLALALSADHGAIRSPEDASGKAEGVGRLNWYEFGSALEAALQKEWPAPGARWILSYQVPHLYLNRALAESRGLSWETFLRRAAKVLENVDGTGSVILTADALSPSYKGAWATVLRRSIRADRSGDLYLMVAEKVLLHDSVPGTSHGSPWDYDARVPLVFWGRGVKVGRHGVGAVADLAPTMARLLGFDYAPGEGGAVRSEVFSAP